MVDAIKRNRTRRKQMKTSMKTIAEMTENLVAVTYKRNSEDATQVTYTAHYVWGRYEVLRSSNSQYVEPYGYAILNAKAERNLCNGAKAHVTFARKSSKSAAQKRDGEISRVEIVEETNENLAAIYLACVSRRLVACNYEGKNKDNFLKIHGIIAKKIASGDKKMYQ
jgi:hypothetical protein